MSEQNARQRIWQGEPFMHCTEKKLREDQSVSANVAVMNGYIFHWLPAGPSADNDERFYLVSACSFEDALESTKAFANSNESFVLYDSSERASRLTEELGLEPGQVMEIIMVEGGTHFAPASAIH